MDLTSATGIVVLLLILLKWISQCGLNLLNQDHVKSRAGSLPPELAPVIDAGTYGKSVKYTLTRARFDLIESAWSEFVLVVLLIAGVLPWGLSWFGAHWGHSALSLAGFLFVVGVGLTLPGLPFAWYEQFHIEAAFGFNTTTRKLWIQDRIKGMILSLALGLPLLTLVLKLVEWAGDSWWLWAWLCVVVFQLVMTVLAPVLIMPLFNKFTPLPPGSLQDRLHALAEKTGFKTRGIQVMDGSRRSTHSNAFFTGFGKFRKIILFDTLVEQLDPAELEAVLAHEIGHYQKRHVLKMMFLSMGSLLAGLALIAWFSHQAWFYAAFGFASGSIVPALLLVSLLGGTVTFWFSPLSHWLSRQWEYQADRYAREAMGTAEPLIAALRKLNEKNLSNLTPHPIYSGFYYSHPTLLEREARLRM